VEHELWIRIETGPWTSFELSQLGESDARAATLKAIMEALTDGKIQSGETYEGKSGDVTAFVSPTIVGRGVSAVIPAMHSTEIIATVRIEGGTTE